MVCKNCGSLGTIRAHLIPKCFAVEVAAGVGISHAIARPAEDRYETSHTGRYDPDLLCAACDSILGDLENYAHRALSAARVYGGAPGRAMEVSPIEPDRLIRFACGIAWKYATTEPRFGRIELGRYRELVRTAAFSGEIASEIDLTMAHGWTGTSSLTFYRAPVCCRTGNGINTVRFVVGGFLLLLKIDRRTLLPGLREAWMRNQSSVVIPVVHANDLSDWRMAQEQSWRPRIATFLNRKNAEAQRVKDRG